MTSFWNRDNLRRKGTSKSFDRKNLLRRNVMNREGYKSMRTKIRFKRREFLKMTGGIGSVVGAGLILGTPPVWTQEDEPPKRPKTNLNDVLSVPKTKHSLPGLFPGRVVEVQDPKAMKEEQFVPDVIQEMFQKCIQKLTGKSPEKSFTMFFDKDDVVGIKVNPVGAGLISTRLEVVDEIINWLVKGGIRRKNIVIWDRMDYMLTDAGFTSDRYPGIRIEGLQMMDREVFEGKEKGKISSLDEKGHHVSEASFDKDVYYWVDVEGPKDPVYLNQHVFNGKYSYFGNLLTKKLTKIINIPVFKNCGNGISVATKNMGYGSICNTNRLHKPLFFDVCVDVLAFPVIRDKLVLNIADGLRAQYEGGPGPAAKFTYKYNRLFLATDPFALDMISHNLLVAKRKSMNIQVNEHPRFTEYLRYAQRLGLGVADIEKIEHLKV